MALIYKVLGNGRVPVSCGSIP